MEDTPATRRERQSWLEWQEFHQNPPPPASRPAVPLKSFHELLEKVGFESEISGITEEMLRERRDAADQHRSTQLLRPFLMGTGSRRFQLPRRSPWPMARKQASLL